MTLCSDSMKAGIPRMMNSAVYDTHAEYRKWPKEVWFPQAVKKSMTVISAKMMTDAGNTLNMKRSSLSCLVSASQWGFSCSHCLSLGVMCSSPSGLRLMARP